MAYRILIVDDEKMLTEVLAEHLRDCGYMAFEANDGEKALEMLKISPDLILLDITMPGMDGLELCRNIRDHVTCPIVFLTARISEQDKVNGFLSGGDDYITKPFSLPEVTARIAAHLRRENRTKVHTDVLGTGELIVNLSKRTVFCKEQEVHLSKREFDIIEFLLINKGMVFDKERLYEAVWGFDGDGDSAVVKEHIRRIRRKLFEVTEREYIETVWGVGYRWKQ